MEGMSCIRMLRSSHFRFLRSSFDLPLQTRTIHVHAAICQRNRQQTTSLAEVPEDEFRVFEIPGLKTKSEARRKQRKKQAVPPPRYQQMRTDQDWTNAWPAAHTFKWSVVPFPVRQGMVNTITENDGVVPSKYANAELMKIPNFLHLTPAHVKKHCAALKEYCTEWPAGLQTNEDCRKHFPVEVQTSDYVFSSPSIRDPRSRTVIVRLKLSDLKLDSHAKDKFIRLAGECYKPATDELVFVSEKCPLKKQNYDYAIYLLTALYNESWKREPWEDEKMWEDMEKYFWDISKSKERVLEMLKTNKEIDKTGSLPESEKLKHIPDDTSEESLLSVKEVCEYRDAVTELMNKGEDDKSLEKYGAAVRKLFKVKGSLVS